MSASPRLLVVQAMWGLVDYPSKAEPWSAERKLAAVREAGFDAVDLDIPYVVGQEAYWRGLLARHGLTLGLQGPFIDDIDQLERCLDVVSALGAPYLDAQIGDYFTPQEEAESLVGPMVARAGAALKVQTHRGKVTQDLLRSVALCRAVPEIELNLDLSHYFVSCGLGPEPLSAEAEAAFEALLRRTSMIDARVSNGHQVQVDVGPRGESRYLAHFERLWTRAMELWLDRGSPGGHFIFRPELGPPDYSIVGLDGKELSDRWEQAKVLAGVGRRCWARALQRVSS